MLACDNDDVATHVNRATLIPHDYDNNAVCLQTTLAVII